MQKLSPGGAKVLVVIHLIFITLWVGGLISWLPLIFPLDTNDYTSTYSTYLHMKAIALNVIGWGGIGSFITGLLLGLFTHWGLFKHRWVTVKFFLVIGLIIMGMFFVEQPMLSNLSLLTAGKERALSDPVFLHNHLLIKWRMMIVLAGFFTVISIAIFKPWMRRKLI